MRAIFIGDLQAHAWSQYSRTLIDGMNDRLMDLITELQRIRIYCKAYNVHDVVILGDIFQERGRLDTIVLNSVYREIEAFRRDKMRVVLLLGNHDRTPVGNFHSLEVFKEIANVVDEPRPIDVDGCKVGAVPFMPEINKMAQWPKMMAEGGARCIIMHAPVKDPRLPWSDGIALNELPTDRWIFMGHFHKYTKLRRHCYYVGSLLQLNWGESKDQKVFGHFHDDKITWVPSKGPVFLEVSEKDFNTRTDLLGNFVRVHWRGPINEAGAVRSYLLDTVGARAVDLVFPPSALIEGLKSLDDPRVRDLVTSYVKSAPLADRPGLLEIGRAILMEAEAYEDQPEEA